MSSSVERTVLEKNKTFEFSPSIYFCWMSSLKWISSWKQLKDKESHNIQLSSCQKLKCVEAWLLAWLRCQTLSNRVITSIDIHFLPHLQILSVNFKLLGMPEPSVHWCVSQKINEGNISLWRDPWQNIVLECNIAQKCMEDLAWLLSCTLSGPFPNVGIACRLR